MTKKRLPGAGERVKVGRRSVTLPGVRSMADSNAGVPSTQSGGAKPEKPTDELSEELSRMIKAAYQ